MKRSWKIAFERMRKDNEPDPYDYVPDSTEFDTDCQTIEEIIAELINLFNVFVCENRFGDVFVSQIREVPYDGEEE